MNRVGFPVTDQWIVDQRGPKNPVDPKRPYGWLVEKEPTLAGIVEDVGTVFLTNSECPFHCLICDLWKNTTDLPVKPGDIPAQLEWALDRMPSVRHIKLYNSGSFFDSHAIPESDYPVIARLLQPFETVIVENHPRFSGDRIVRFSRMLSGRLQVAMGLETVNPSFVRQMNKRMVPGDFALAMKSLTAAGIAARAFVLLKPPFHTEEEGVRWAKKTLDFAFDSGAACCAIIPVRAGNGAMDRLAEAGLFSPPDIRSLEEVTEYGIIQNRGIVLADLWDIERFSSCSGCKELRINRLESMNHTQAVPCKTECSCDI